MSDFYEKVQAESEITSELNEDHLHDNYEWFVILSEEVGEVAKAINENDRVALISELVQVASVCKCRHDILSAPVSELESPHSDDGNVRMILPPSADDGQDTVCTSAGLTISKPVQETTQQPKGLAWDPTTVLLSEIGHTPPAEEESCE